MTNALKIGGKMLIGALIGFFSMMALLNMDIRLNFQPFASIANVMVLGLSAVLLVFAIFSYFQIKKLTQKELSGDEEDEVGAWMYKRYSDASLCSTLSIIFSLAGMSIAILTGQSAWQIAAAVTLLFIGMVPSFAMPGLMRMMYPERQLPSLNDKNYPQKLLEISDDGEKHVMLNGLYRSFINMNSLLLGAVLLLFFYSIASGNSQLFGILVISAILTVSNFQYILNIRNK